MVKVDGRTVGIRMAAPTIVPRARRSPDTPTRNSMGELPTGSYLYLDSRHAICSDFFNRTRRASGEPDRRRRPAFALRIPERNVAGERLMEMVEVPVVDESVTLTDAYDALKASRKSGLVVRHHDGPRLYEAKTLELQLSHAPGESMTQVAGGIWLHAAHDQVLAFSEPFVGNIEGDSAMIGGLPDDLLRQIQLAVRVYCCSLDPLNHQYDSAQYKRLPVVNGVRYCTTQDGGTVS
jgi:hypothetical protein